MPLKNKQKSEDLKWSKKAKIVDYDKKEKLMEN